MKEKRPYDVAIIGGGIAGMTAAIYTAKANRSCVILESDITGGLANSTYTVENYPSYIEVHGIALMQKIRDQVEHLGVTVEEICEVTSLNLTTQAKIIETEEALYEAGAIIVATGRKPIPLDVPTKCDQIHYCAICDGAPYKGRKVLVVGGGNSAFSGALYLKQLGVSHIAVVEHMDSFAAARQSQERLLGCENVSGHLRCAVTDVLVEDGALRSALLENKKTQEKIRVEVDGIFVFMGQSPNSELFKGILDLDEAGYVKTDENLCTNIPGIFSAGDINVKRFRQLTTAAADGTIAALMADSYLRAM
jgi:thioredoxin reductase (NADPH)